MAAVSLTVESARELLSQAIVDVVKSFPEHHRRIFTQVHYAGSSIEEAARSSGLAVLEIRQILQHCERKLRNSLKKFRTEIDSAAQRAVWTECSKLYLNQTCRSNQS